MNNKLRHSIWSAILLAGCASTSTQPIETIPPMQSVMQKSSYAQGVRYMQNLRASKIPLDQDLFLQGMGDVINDKPLRLNETQLDAGEAWVFAQSVQYKEKLMAENMAKGKAFLDANKQKPGIHSLASGVQYQVLAEGKSREKPTLKDKVHMRYKITHIDGKVFSSPEKPKEFPMNPMIKGWQEALLLMTKGSRWLIFIPGPLAYGEIGAPGKVGPNETMVFDVELLDIKVN